MARVVDLGWTMARCNGTELELMEPASEDGAANSMRVVELEHLIALRDFLTDCISDETERQELIRKTVSPGIDNGGATG